MLVRHVHETPVEAVRPAVIATDERFRATRAGRERRAAMPAGVPKRVDAAVVRAKRDDRRAGRVPRDVASRLAKRRGWAKADREPAEHPFALGREARLGAIVLDRLPPGR